MAYTKIINIKTRLDKAVNYILNPAKTEHGLYTGGFNCMPENAIAKMNNTKNAFNKKDKRLGYHIIQSFEPGEVTPDVAFKIGSEYAMRYLSDKYEVIFSTHIDKDHIHNHIVWNSVSCIDGKKYHSDKNEYKDQIRKISDDICKENNLSVIDVGQNQSVNKHYAEWQAVKQGKITWRDVICVDIDTAIQNTMSWNFFLLWLKDGGYEIKQGKYISLKCDGMERFVRLKTLGNGYTKKDICKRIDNQNEIDVTVNMHTFYQRSYRKPIPEKYKGFQALVWHYVYLLGIVKRGKANFPISEQMKKDILHFDKITAQFKFLHKHDIKTHKGLNLLKEKTFADMQNLIDKRKSIPAENRKEINIEIRGLRRELKQIENIRNDIPRINRILNPKPQKEKSNDDIIRDLNRSR